MPFIYTDRHTANFAQGPLIPPTGRSKLPIMPASPATLKSLRNRLALKGRLQSVLDLNPRARSSLLALALGFANAVPQEHHLNVAGGNAPLLRAPAVLPQRSFVLSFLRLVLCVVE